MYIICMNYILINYSVSVGIKTIKTTERKAKIRIREIHSNLASTSNS